MSEWGRDPRLQSLISFLRGGFHSFQLAVVQYFGADSASRASRGLSYELDFEHRLREECLLTGVLEPELAVSTARGSLPQSARELDRLMASGAPGELASITGRLIVFHFTANDLEAQIVQRVPTGNVRAVCQLSDEFEMETAPIRHCLDDCINAILECQPLPHRELVKLLCFVYDEAVPRRRWFGHSHKAWAGFAVAETMCELRMLSRRSLCSEHEYALTYLHYFLRDRVLSLAEGFDSPRRKSA